MILSLLLLAAAPEAAARYDTCVAATRTDPAQAIATAGAWRDEGGGTPARQCLGLALVAAERFGEAAATFAEAADRALAARDGRAATLWVQAGNAALAGDDPMAARAHLDRALALTVLSPAYRGEALLDRGRADVALGDSARARADIDAALALVPGDPMAWLLSATLARRGDDLPRAQKDIAQAVKLAGDSAPVQLEAGNIAARAGLEPAARAAWTKAAQLDPASPAGRSATAALKANGG